MGNTPDIIPTLRYQDARAAITWLEEVLGFRRVLVVDGSDGPEGSVAHAQLALGNGLVMLASVPTEDEDRIDLGSGPSAIYLVIDDVAAAWKRASSFDVEVVREFRSEDYGGEGFSIRDPEGNVWSVGSYRPSTEG
ncbi:VOC family protein [Salinactinospora qingdaonensis]|uniref:VOC family protein n=1 Tax=Salinactinospora qingdaonensis TaxID=702744 RepID=A0ABP7F8Z4_9ACTN